MSWKANLSLLLRLTADRARGQYATGAEVRLLLNDGEEDLQA